MRRWAAFKDTRINCDLKEYGLEEDVLALARACGLPAKRILYSGSGKACGAVPGSVPWREVEVFWNVEECIRMYTRWMNQDRGIL